GPQEKVDEAHALAMQLDEAAQRPDQKIEVLNLEYAAADEVSRGLQGFFNDRARLEGKRQADVTIAGSRTSATLIVSGTDDDLALVKDLVSRLDLPEAGEDRRIQVYALKSAQAVDVSRVVTAMFPRSRGSRENDVIVTADARTNSLILSAPEERFTEVDALIARLDTTPTDEVVMVRTFTLSTGRADDVADILTEALDLGRSARGRAGDLRPIMMDEAGEPVRIKATITPDRRSNTLVISANPESFPLLERMIAELDEQPFVNPREYRVIHIKHVIARDISTTLRTLTLRRDYGSDDPPAITSQSTDNTLIISATTDQFQELEGMIAQLDVPSTNPRITEFVPLKHAEAVQVREALSVFYGRYAAEATTPAAENTSIVADPATNSLVISSVEEEWPRIRELIDQLDSEEYDTSRQLRVLALKHADAGSVAQAINAAFEIQVDRRRSANDRADNRNRNEEERDAPTLLVEPEEVVRVSAEPRSNSIIVSANLRNMERVEAIVETLDVADYALLPPPQIIPLSTARAAELVNSLRQMYEQQRTSRGQATRRTIIIGHDTASNTIIVRAEEDEFAEIKALALALEDTATDADISIRIIALKQARAARVLSVLNEPMQIKARQLGQPLSIQVDRLANSLVIATSAAMFAQVEPVIKEMDALGPALEGEEGNFSGKGVYIIPVEHVSPDEMQRLLQSMGLTRRFRDDEATILTEPIQVQTLTSLRSLIVTASPIDRQTVLRLVAQLDQAPLHADQDLEIIPLRTATASTVATTLREMIDPSEQDAQTGPAEAIREQIRRLNLRQAGLGQDDLSIDLSEPIRILEDSQTNSIILSASPANLASLREIIALLDTLPIGDQVTISIFHLDSADARQIESVVRSLFQQGEAVSRALGSRRMTLPPTTTGYALAGEIGIATDERTNALIVAGREEAVALVEVLIQSLDSDEAARWVEPRVIQLTYADAADLAETLQMILVEGQRGLPQSTAIQRQVSRLRILREGAEPLTTDVFTPMARLIIEPDDKMNALIVVGTTVNVDAVAELVAQLDTPAASPNASVRIYPLENGDADRVSRTVEQFFRDQLSSGLIRDEDDVQVAVDQRTNTLIVSTSPRSFTVLENLLDTLDSATPNPTVGVHVLPVPGSDVERLADRIERIMRDRRAALGSSATDADRVSIQPDQGSNSLIVAANDDNLTTIQRIIDLLTQAEVEAAELGKGFTVLPLKAAQADDVVRTLRDLYVDEINRTRGENTLSVTADDRLNSVLVSGIQEDIKEIEELVKLLDQAPTHTVREIRILALKAANALEMESLLRSVLSGRSVASRAGAMRQATMLRFLAAKELEREVGEKVTEAQITSAIQEQISITPDVRTNALIVAALGAVELVDDRLDEIDRLSRGGDDERGGPHVRGDADLLLDG
ncbi:MAG: secretin N-terminal domain-containing protein, partial [Phycisphaerales bacterium JB038]